MQTQGARTAATARAGLARWLPLIAVCLTMFIVTIDSTMMNVAISAIVDDLDTTLDAVQAGIAIYSLVMAAFMTAGGKIATIVGTKKAFVVALVIYGIGTTMAAVSQSVQVLVLGWSVIEGLAGAALIPICLSLLIVNYTDKQRAMSFAVMGGVQSSAAALGPIVGGALTTYASWRWGLGGEAVIVLIVLWLARGLVGSPPQPEQKLDIVGVALTALGLGSIVGGTLLAGTYGWWAARRPFEVAGQVIAPFGLSPTPLLIGLGIVLLVVFARWTNRRTKSGLTPLFDLRILRIREYSAGSLVISVMTFCIGGIMFILPLFLQMALDFSAFATGVALLPLSIALLVTSLGTGRLGAKVPPRLLVQAGVVFLGVGVSYYRANVAFDMTAGEMALPFACIGFGLGLILGQINNLTLSAVPQKQSSEASGLTNTVKELGRSVGVAIIGSALAAGIYSGVVTNAAEVAHQTISEARSGELAIRLQDATRKYSDEAAFREHVVSKLPKVVQENFREIVRTSVVEGMRSTLAIIIGMTILLLLITTFLQGGRLSEVKQPPGEYTHAHDEADSIAA